jgi:predicted DNA-binding WGR domain protein
MLDGRRPLKVGAVFNTKTRLFKSEDAAKAFEEKRIKVKLRKGYKRTLRRS